MKKIYLILAITFGLLSCNDAIDILPENVIVEEVVFENVADLQLGMNGAYASYAPETEITFSSIFSDDTKIGESTGGQQVNFHNWILNPNTGTSNAIWNNNYIMINDVNRILAAAPSIEPQSGEEDQYNSILGECYALRALGHFNVAKFYSTSYDAATPSVPYVDFVGVFEQLPRIPYGELMTAIKADLDEAQARIPASANDNTRITRDFITALRARIALYEGSWSEAETLSQSLINKYPLASQIQYVNMFNDEDDSEVIFKADRVQGDALAGSIWMFTNSGGSFIEVSNELVAIIPGGDIRNITTWTNEDAVFNVDTEEHVNKYPGSGGIRYLNDIKVFRVSEMYLINAEAKARMSSFGPAGMMVQAVRDARTGSVGSAPAYGGLAAAINDILFERRLELCFEGHRYLDIKRTRDITGTGIVRSAADSDCQGGSGTPECVLEANDFRFTAPIPAAELDANQNIEQAPGY